MILRIIAATLLGPLVASATVGLAFCLYWTVVAGFSEGFARSAYEGLGGFFAFLFFGTLITGGFAIVFAILTQLPLLFALRWWGQWPMWGHLIWSGSAGLLGFFAFLRFDSRQLPRGLMQEGWINVFALGSMGILGGLGVGLLWYLLVFRAPSTV